MELLVNSMESSIYQIRQQGMDYIGNKTLNNNLNIWFSERVLFSITILRQKLVLITNKRKLFEWEFKYIYVAEFALEMSESKYEKITMTL